MSLISGLHGVVATVLLCGLLFTEEAGIPLPFAPGELTLLAAGLLIATGGLDPFAFIPLAVAACVAGAMIGFGWSRALGEHGLRSLAQRLHQGRTLERASRRLRHAGSRGIAVSRLIPGLRIITTLVAGALGVERRVYAPGLVASTVIWVLTYTLLGAAVGLPAEHYLGELQKLTVQGGVLVVIGIGGYLAVRHVPSAADSVMDRMPQPPRVAGALAVDIGVIACVAAGLLAIARRVSGLDLDVSWSDGVVVIGVVIAFYVVAARRGPGATAGEALMRTTYLARRRTLSPRPVSPGSDPPPPRR